MNNFVVCFDLEKKNELKNRGLEYLHTTIINNKEAYVFANVNTLEFSREDNVILTDKLSF